MLPPPLHPLEEQRLRCLASLDVLETPPEPVLDGLVRCAAHLTRTPIALVSLTDAERQWFKSRFGIDRVECPRELSFCGHGILSDGLFEVQDALSDERFADNPLVTGEPHVRFYAGVPLRVDGLPVGMLCVVDREPRQLDPTQRQLLRDLGVSVSSWLRARREHLQLVEAQRRSETAVDAAQLGLLEFDADSHVVAMDTRAAAHHGLPPQPTALGLDAWLGRLQVRDVSLPALRAQLEAPAPDLNLTLETSVGPASSDAEPASISIHLRAYRDSASRHVKLVGATRDVTGELHVERLRREKQAAEFASREKTAFLSRVSHELRTPLNAILGFTQLLQSESEPPLGAEQREQVERVHTAGTLLLGLINQVLDLSRIEQGALQLDFAPLSLGLAVAESLPMVQSLAASRGVAVVLDHGPAPFVLADLRSAKQVLLNLLSNGVKYNRLGGRLFVSWVADGPMAGVEVRDEGAGIDPERVGDLFRPFNRLGAETSGVEGSGLGLVISRQLAQAMGGTIGVTSEHGRGATFRFMLPRAEAPDSTLPVAAPPATPGATPADSRMRTLLYIEDDSVNAMLLQQVMRTEPTWQVEVAGDGPGGLALARVLRPDVVLTDVNLPGMSGIDVMHAIKRDPALRHIPCIALSADALPEQIDAALAAGFDDYWTKPVEIRAMRQKLRTLAARPVMDRTGGTHA